jgi:hypothetical protein
VYFLAPLLVFLILLLLLYNMRLGEGIRRAILWSAVLVGTYAVLLTEFLTIFHAVTTTNLIIAWVFPAPLLSYLLLKRLRKDQKISLPSYRKPEGLKETSIWFGIAFILITTALVAWKSPPQTWDSLNYHMSRVAHWAQQAGLQHFATGIEVQNNMAPGAEILVLQTYLLSASDSWVNFVQWLAMIGSALGASWVAHQLGAGRWGQLLSAVFVLTIPMGIAESTSTMTDYVVSFWIICAVAESLEILKGKTSANGLGILGAAAGLAILTKPTAFAFLSPFALFVVLQLLKGLPTKQMMNYAGFVIAIVLILNLGHFTRNTVTYANPIGPEDRFDQHANQLRSLRGLTSNLIRNTAMHLQTPSTHVNKAIATGVRWVHELMNLDVNDPRTTAAGQFKVSLPRTNEILVGNPLHAILILLLIGITTWRWKSLKFEQAVYVGSLILSALLFSFLFKWLIFGTRLQLPLFVLGAPLIGILFGEEQKGILGPSLGVVLIIASIPWVVSIDSRPIIPIEDRSFVGSVTTESDVDLLFANGDFLKEPTRDVVIKIEEHGCTEVGLMIAGNSVEYTFWTMLGAPRSQVQFEWIVEGTPSAKHSSATFDPCAIICENCPIEGDMFRGLKLIHSRAPYRLYLMGAEPVQ